MKIYKGTILLLLSKYRYNLKRPIKKILFLLTFFIYLNSIKHIQSLTNNLFSQETLTLANIIALIYCFMLLIVFHTVNSALKSMPYNTLYLSPNSLFVNNLKYSKEIFMSKILVSFIEFSILTLIISLHFISSFFYGIISLVFILMITAILTLYLPYKISKMNLNPIAPQIILLILLIYSILNLIKSRLWFISYLILTPFETPNAKLATNNILKITFLVILISLSTLIPYPKMHNFKIKIKKSILTIIRLIKSFSINYPLYKKISLYQLGTELSNKIIQSTYFFALSSIYNFKKFLKISLESLVLMLVSAIISSILFEHDVNPKLMLFISTGYFVYNLSYFILLPNLKNICFLLNLNNKKIIYEIIFSLKIYIYMLTSFVSIIFLLILKIFIKHHLIKFNFLEFFILLSFLNTTSIFWSIFLSIFSNPNTLSFTENNLGFIGYTWICIVPTLFISKLYEKQPIIAFVLVLFSNLLILRIISNLYKLSLTGGKTK